MAEYSRLPMCVCIYSTNGADGQDELSIGSKAPLPVDSRLMLDSLHRRLLDCRLWCPCVHLLDICGLLFDALWSFIDACESLLNARESLLDVSGRHLKLCAASRFPRELTRNFRKSPRCLPEPR